VALWYRITVIVIEPSHVRRSLGHRRGFTLLELLVVLGLITVLIGLTLAGVSTLRKYSQAVRCISHLRQIGAAFNQYAISNNRMFPNPDVGSATSSWEKTLFDGGYIGDPDILRCPADTLAFAATNSSYDWRDTGDDTTTLAGRALTDNLRGNFVLANEMIDGFHLKKKINAVFIDGSARQLDMVACVEDLKTPIRNLTTQPTGTGPILSGK
jgi:prepilin-type N-terminal cleavage/methylation domain-containing protein